MKRIVVEKLSRLAVWSVASATLGLFVGVIFANVYQRVLHPGDPDPVDFTVGLVLLASFLLIWVFGTAVGLWRVFRNPSSEQ